MPADRRYNGVGLAPKPPMEKRVTFSNRWLPYLLVAPQIAITLVFFIWPAYRALEQSFFLEDAFGFSRQWV